MLHKFVEVEHREYLKSSVKQDDHLSVHIILHTDGGSPQLPAIVHVEMVSVFQL